MKWPRRFAFSPKRKRNLADFHPETAADGSEPAPLARLLLFTIVLFLAVALIWSSLGTVEQMANASGIVRPFGRFKIVNHPERGQVTMIHVREGTAVAKDETLLALDTSLLDEEIGRLTDQWRNLAAEIARLEAEATGTRPDFALELRETRPDLERLQMRLFESRAATLASDRKISERIVEQRASNIEALRRKVEDLEASAVILKKQERSVGELAAQGFFPELRYLSIQRQRSEAEGRLAETQERLTAAFAALAEARARLEAVEQKWNADVLDRLATAQKEHDQVFGALAQLKARRAALVIRAPDSGIVQNLQVTSIGQAIGKNEPLMHIVPTTDSLIVEARVKNRDIGHVSIGQAARVKFRTYDFLRFGSLEGVVEQVAANAVAPANGGGSYFPVVIRTARNYLGATPDKQPVQPGMEVDVDLRIGERTILSYFTDRIFRTRAAAFREQ
ncbi:MAG: HlyD family type I secretion periplasmic adaptor subunit [Alphaproteobacteria bacterium]|nr:HlyD family type I secretion periplasmic adaptor subunit [Alphaproteobacteria bacterium]